MILGIMAIREQLRIAMPPICALGRAWPRERGHGTRAMEIS
jgi:hypothetical protein